MNANTYLQSYGWVEGEALQKGGLRKPILVKHKKDNKGLGANKNDADLWWERLFDGQLKSLEVSSSSKGISFEKNEAEVEDHMRKATSPLYKMFVRGEGLKGTVGKPLDPIKTKKTDSNEKKEKKDKKDKTEKKEKKEKKKDKKEKKKDKKDKKKSSDKEKRTKRSHDEPDKPKSKRQKSN